MSAYIHPSGIGQAISRLRAKVGVTQAVLAEQSGLDQSRISRLEKGEMVEGTDVDRVFAALGTLGAGEATQFKEYMRRDWTHVERPSFWNPQRACLEIAEEMLAEIESFVADADHPWPLRRQIERHKDSLLRAATFLCGLKHNIAFIGDMGVGKSTAISFIFELLMPPSATKKTINRPVLETGGGGTTICEVHIKSGPEVGISLLPMSDAEIGALVSDFCTAKWIVHSKKHQETSENIVVSREAERAIRNMSGLARTRATVKGRPVYDDPVVNLVETSSSEDEFRSRVLSLMNLDNRTRRELWHDKSSRKDPMEWASETFRAVNNGRLKDVPLPKSIDLLLPNFGQEFGELDITVIDTKGVDDVAVREDLDRRLKDPRTTIVFCSRFNDAPGTSTRALLQHMRQTFSDKLDSGKVAVLALPRSEEARAMKDDMGEQALTDEEGYEFKKLHVSSELSAEDLSSVPMLFCNVESDATDVVRDNLYGQLDKMRNVVEESLFDLCAACQDIIENHEAQALNAAMEEVANRLNSFLKGNRELGTREQLAYEYAINTIKGVRFASTLWASTRRNGEYTNLDVVHFVGVGAARDARLRSESWFDGLDAFLKSLKADEGLKPASRSIDQIGASAVASRRAFLEAAYIRGVEAYRKPLSQASVWPACTSEWGRGPGFKLRVVDRLTDWFRKKRKPKDRLEQMINGLWDELVIDPLKRLAEERGPEAD